MKSNPVSRVLAGLTAVAIAAVPAAAYASHYRSVYSTFDVSGDTLSWNVINATEVNNSDLLGEGMNILSVTNADDEPNSGTDTGVTLSYDTSVVNEDGDEGYIYSTLPLYESTIEYLVADISSLSDGKYQAYSTNSARLDGVQNQGGEDSVSAWMSFTISGGVVNHPPVFNDPSLYELIDPDGSDVVIDFRATDPEGTSVTYEYVTTNASPYYAGSEIPCSTFSAGLLTVGASQCTGGEVFSDIFSYDPDVDDDVPSWVAKVQAKDAGGNVITSDVLLRLLSAPYPYIDNDVRTTGTDYEFDIFTPDTIADYLSIECINDADETDVVFGEGTSTPLTLRNFTVGAEYTCTPYAENGAGGNDGDTYSIGPVEGLMLNLDLAVGVEFAGASSNIVGGGLKANSEYTLTMYSDPIEIYAGVSDANGNFDEDVTIPAEACIPGIHHLILSGVDPDDNPVQDEQWVEIGADCEVLQFADTEITESLAATGFNAVDGLLIAGGLGAAGLIVLTLRRRQRQL